MHFVGVFYEVGENTLTLHGRSIFCLANSNCLMHGIGKITITVATGSYIMCINNQHVSDSKAYY